MSCRRSYPNPGRRFKTLCKTDFSDEVAVAVEFLMLQIDPTGKKPIILPPMPAEDYVPDSVVKSRGGKGVLSE